MEDSPTNISPAKHRKHHPVRLFLKSVAWLALAILLFVFGTVMGVVAVLTPERLTPIVERIATQSLQNAEVKIERVELTIVSSFPFVHAQIDNLSVLSTISKTLTSKQRQGLPQYTDTVLTVRQFKGGLDVLKLFSNQLDLADVIIDNPSANIVIIDDKTTNFDIIPPSEEKDEKPFDWKDVPGISLKRFAIINPGTVRFFNKQTGTAISATFKEVELNGNDAPRYRLNFDGEIQAPSEFLEKFKLSDINFGLNGSLRWSQERPTILSVDDFHFSVSVIGGKLNTEVDFSKGVVVKRLAVDMEPFNIHQLMLMVPPGVAREFNIPTTEELKTNATLKMDFTIKEPWNVGSDIVPPLDLNIDMPASSFTGYDIHTDAIAATIAARINKPWPLKQPLPDMSMDIQIPQTSIQWQDLNLQKFLTDLTVTVPDGNLNKAIVTINELSAQAQAAQIDIQGSATNLMTDPYFDGSIDGSLDISRLPQKILNAIDGTVAGNITAHIGVRGAPSMFTPQTFHKLYVNGDMQLDNVYWISGDTINMVDINKANLHFGTSDQLSGGKIKIDSLLRVNLQVDKAAIVHSDIAMDVKDFSIGLATQNKSYQPKKGEIMPVGGKLELGAFNMLKTTDSTIVRLRGVQGLTVIKAYNNDLRTPHFIFDLDIKRVAAGDRETRFMVSDAHTHLDARRVAKSASAKRFSHIADSIHYVHPHLSPDSVANLALAIHNRHKGRYPRVHEKYEANQQADIIDWGASPMFKRILSLWSFDGTLTSQRAGLFTPMLPLRNRLRNLDISFNNDSIIMNQLQYKIGHSDFTINGVVSNMRKAFTSGSGKQPLRINFEAVSDTIDINQLTEAIMLASAYSEQEGEHKKLNLAQLDEDEEALERHIARLTENAPDTMMPILIPQNIDAQFGLRANNVLYSDFELKNMSGRILAFDGALNMQNLYAQSDVGSLNLTALYTGLHPDHLRFGFGLKLSDFNISRFLSLVPAIDSLMPVMRDLSGIVSVDIAATADVDRQMNLVIPTLDAAVQIQGDSLVLLDPDTFKKVAKWLFFRNKKRNIIDHMNVNMTIKDNQIDVYPFIFDFDRYKLGIQGYNDFDMNFKYHIAVLKSPIPFKFGINVSGNPDKFKVRLGGAKFGEKQVREVSIVDTTRINLMNEINNVFKRGARKARLSRLKIDKNSLAANIDLSDDTLTRADSIRFMQEGLIDTPPGFFPVDTVLPTHNTPHPPKETEKKAKLNKSAFGIIGSLPTVAVLRSNKRRRRNNKNQHPVC